MKVQRSLQLVILTYWFPKK